MLALICAFSLTGCKNINKNGNKTEVTAVTSTMPNEVTTVGTKANTSGFKAESQSPTKRVQ